MAQKKCSATWEKQPKQVVEVEIDSPGDPADTQYFQGEAKPGQEVTIAGTKIKIPADLPEHTVIYTYTNPLFCGWYLQNGTYVYRCKTM